MQTNIIFRVRYLCGCEDTILTMINIPKALADAARNDETDQKIIGWLETQYDLSSLHCNKKHRSIPTGFDRIIEIL